MISADEVKQLFQIKLLELWGYVLVDQQKKKKKKKLELSAADMGQIWNVVKESKWKHILVELLNCWKDSLTVWSGWMVNMQVINTGWCWNDGNAKCILEINHLGEHLSWHPVSDTGGFWWWWPKTVNSTERPKETRFEPPFHPSGSIFCDEGCAFVPGGCQTCLGYSLLLLVYSRFRNLHLWWLLGMF